MQEKVVDVLSSNTAQAANPSLRETCCNTSELSDADAPTSCPLPQSEHFNPSSVSIEKCRHFELDKSHINTSSAAQFQFRPEYESMMGKSVLRSKLPIETLSESIIINPTSTTPEYQNDLKVRSSRVRESSARSSVSILLTSSQQPLNGVLGGHQSEDMHQCCSSRRRYTGNNCIAPNQQSAGSQKYVVGSRGGTGMESSRRSRWSSCSSKSRRMRSGGGQCESDILMHALNVTLRDNIDLNIDKLRHLSGQLGQERLKILDDTKKCLDVMIAVAKYSGLK